VFTFVPGCVSYEILSWVGLVSFCGTSAVAAEWVCDWISTFNFHSNPLWLCTTVVWGTRALDPLLNSHLLTIALPPRSSVNYMVAFYFFNCYP